MSALCIDFFGAAGDPGATPLGAGAELLPLMRLGLPVPPGFTLSVSATEAIDQNKALSDPIRRAVFSAVERLEAVTEKRFGDPTRPLLLWISSGAPTGLPGTQIAIPDLGMSDSVVQTMMMANERFALDCQRRFLSKYGEFVLGDANDESPSAFEVALYDFKSSSRVSRESALSTEDLRELVTQYRKIVGDRVPQEAREQLAAACAAFFIAAQAFETDLVSINVSVMVHGNAGATSLSGLISTHDPSTGRPGLFGEYLPDAQPGDIVTGTRIPRTIEELEESMPEIFSTLGSYALRLMQEYRDSLDLEFVVEEGTLWVLRCREATLTARASIRVAVELVEAGLITKNDALMRVTSLQIRQVAQPSIDPEEGARLIAHGVAASLGVAGGAVVFSSADVLSAGTPTILVVADTEPEDVPAMSVARGVVTTKGGLTSHAAIVCRSIGRPCIVNATEIHIDLKNRCFATRGMVVGQGDPLTIDGRSGKILLGRLPGESSDVSPALERLLSWADGVAKGPGHMPWERIEAAQAVLRETK